jgi:hypothetical protein
MIRIVWKNFSKGEEPNRGHGIEFLSVKEKGERQLFAFLEDFRWYHGYSEEMTVWIRSDLEYINPDAYKIIQQAVERAAANKEIINGQLSNTVLAWVNG